MRTINICWESIQKNVWNNGRHSETFQEFRNNFINIIIRNRPFSDSKHIPVLTDYRFICTRSASIISKLFIGPGESLWNFKVFVLLRLCILYFAVVGICE
jgi:hypothetical protein